MIPPLIVGFKDFRRLVGGNSGACIAIISADLDGEVAAISLSENGRGFINVELVVSSGCWASMVNIQCSLPDAVCLI
jgi:hypothetical protein